MKCMCTYVVWKFRITCSRVVLSLSYSLTIVVSSLKLECAVRACTNILYWHCNLVENDIAGHTQFISLSACMLGMLTLVFITLQLECGNIMQHCGLLINVFTTQFINIYAVHPQDESYSLWGSCALPSAVF